MPYVLFVYIILFFSKWTDATFAEPLMNNIKRANYVMPRAIQKTAIPLILDNYDVLGHAETGSGKTAVCFTIFEMFIPCNICFRLT